MWQAYMPPSVLQQGWKAQARFDWDDRVEFMPYWRASSLVSHIEDYYHGGSWPLADGQAPAIPLPARSFRMMVLE